MFTYVYVLRCVCKRAWFCMLHLNILRRRNTHQYSSEEKKALYTYEPVDKIVFIVIVIIGLLRWRHNRLMTIFSTWVALKRCTHVYVLCIGWILIKSKSIWIICMEIFNVIKKKQEKFRVNANNPTWPIAHTHTHWHSSPISNMHFVLESNALI